MTDLDIFITEIADAVMKYDSSGDHKHRGSPIPGDCIRCLVVAALPERTRRACAYSAVKKSTL